MSKLTVKYNGSYTIEQLIEAANKLGLSVPETDDQFQAIADDIRDKREYQVILDVENGFEAETPERTESERVIHSFMADLVGTRRGLQDKFKNELVRSFCELIFNKAIEKLTENPFALNTLIFIHEKDFTQYNQIKCLIINEGSYSLSKKVTNLVADLGIKNVKIDTSCNMLSIMIDYE